MIPAIKDGRGVDMMRHWLAMYPRDWTKSYREKLFGKKRKRWPKHIATTRKKAGLSLGYTEPSEEKTEALKALDLLDR